MSTVVLLVSCRRRREADRGHYPLRTRWERGGAPGIAPRAPGSWVRARSVPDGTPHHGRKLARLLGLADRLVERDESGLEQALDVLIELSLIHISAPTRQAEISYAVFC